MKRRKREIQVFNLSFLDVVSCGFGAIILLLVISKFSEPMVVEKMSLDLRGLVVEREEQLHEIRGETRIVNRELKTKKEQLSEYEDAIARLLGDLSSIKGQYKTAKLEQDSQSLIENQLQTARQSLTEEMERLQNQDTYQPPAPDSAIGGIPVDSEYIIFIIDTSGSMQSYAWPLVRQKMAEILTIYPHVKGIQVMNDMGDYMFSQYAGKWIPDTRPVADPFSNGWPHGVRFQTQAQLKALPGQSADFTLLIRILAFMYWGTISQGVPFKMSSTRWNKKTSLLKGDKDGYEFMPSDFRYCSLNQPPE